MGIARVADSRLDALAEMSKSKKVVHATVELVDIAGLVAGARRARAWATASSPGSARSMR